MAAQGSVLTNKYSEGYPGRRYYGGNYVVDEVEDLARDRAKALFGADHANVQPHSGANANMATYLALLQPGDTVLGMRLDQGGHLTHGSPVNFSGRIYHFVSYGVSESDERLDYDQIRDLAKEHRPKAIVAGATAYPRVIDPVVLRSIADEVGALLIFDAAHIAGLIAGGAHPNPVPFADVVTFTTHKTLRGPRAGCILTTAEHATAIDKAVFPGSAGGAVDARDRGQGGRLPGGVPAVVPRLRGPDRGQRPGPGRGPGGGGVPAGLGRHRQPPHARRPAALRRRAHRQGGPERPRPRPGSPSTRTRSRATPGRRSSPAACGSAPPPPPPRGWARPEMGEIAALIGRTLRQRDDEQAVADIRDEVATLCSKFTPYPDD